MVKTKVVNDTASEIDVREGNVGVYIPLQTLSKKGSKNSSCVIQVDTNATYREYWIAALADNTGKRPIVVTSDDCIDNSVLTIKYVEEQYVCDKTPRNAKLKSAPNPQHNGNHNSGGGSGDDDNKKTPAKAGWKEKLFAKWGSS